MVTSMEPIKSPGFLTLTSNIHDWAEVAFSARVRSVRASAEMLHLSCGKKRDNGCEAGGGGLNIILARNKDVIEG